MMKTKHLLLAMTALSMAACSQNEMMDGAQGVNTAIGFSVYTSTQTRGVNTDFDAVKAGNLGIMAYYTGTDTWADKGAEATPNVMYNQKVTYADVNGWTYSPVKYWPEEEGSKMSFFAYAPYANGLTFSANTAKGAPTLTFTVNEDPTEMIDLVADAKTDRTKANGKIPFTMGHVLSRVTFAATAMVESPNTTISVKSAQLKSDESLYKAATYQFGGNWNYDAATSFTNYSLNNILNLTEGTLALQANGEGESLFKADEYLFMIPVANAGGTANAGDIKVEFTYDVTTTDIALASGSFTVTNIKTVSLPVGALKMSKAYKYTFNFTPTAIEVDAVDVADWGTEIEGSTTL